MLHSKQCKCLLFLFFQGLIQILKEDNIAKELPIGYRLDLETVVPKSKKKDLVFKVCACNAVRECLDGRTISLNFLHSLKSASRGETSTFQEVRYIASY